MEEETPHSRSRPPFPAPVAHLLTNLFIALDLEDNTLLTRRRARILRLANSTQVVARCRTRPLCSISATIEAASGLRLMKRILPPDRYRTHFVGRLSQPRTTEFMA